LDGDSKFAKANGPRSQMGEHHFLSLKTLGCTLGVYEMPNRGIILEPINLQTK
jgi:hypothetical protein